MQSIVSLVLLALILSVCSLNNQVLANGDGKTTTIIATASVVSSTTTAKPAEVKVVVHASESSTTTTAKPATVSSVTVIESHPTVHGEVSTSKPIAATIITKKITKTVTTEIKPSAPEQAVASVVVSPTTLAPVLAKDALVQKNTTIITTEEKPAKSLEDGSMLESRRPGWGNLNIKASQLRSPGPRETERPSSSIVNRSSGYRFDFGLGR